jgi:STE24 endopeptidase
MRVPHSTWHNSARCTQPQHSTFIQHSAFSIQVNEDKATRYHRLQRRALLLWAPPALAMGLAFILGNGSIRLRDFATTVTGSGPSDAAAVGVYALAFMVGYHALLLPLAFYQGFVLERRYGLGTAPLSTWLIDFTKAAAVVSIPSAGLAAFIYGTMRWWPAGWWIASAAGLAGVLFALARAAPVALMPLFYRLAPLDRAPLRTRLTALCQRAGVPVLGVYGWGLGEKSRRANAALIGAGAARRILLSDTLLADYSDDEIEVILAHEIGHHVHADIRTALIVESALITISLALGAVALGSMWTGLRLHGPSDVAGLPLLIGIGALVSLAARPLLQAMSRRHERRADDFALALTGQPSAFASAIRRLAAQNLAEERPSRTALWLFHTHPPLEQRLERAREYQSMLVPSSPPAAPADYGSEKGAAGHVEAAIRLDERGGADALWQ